MAIPSATQTTEEYLYDPVYSDNDGDILLKVDNTLFCAHTSKLKQQTGLFHDMFSLPQPDNPEKIGDLPRCDMYNVSPAEFRYLLDFIYGRIHLIQEKAGQLGIHFSAAIALLKVGTRLDLPLIRRKAGRALHLMFPCGVEHDVVPATLPLIMGLTMPKDLFLRHFPIQAINAFKECQTPIYLPMAFYYAAQLSIQDIIFGVKGPDGVVEKLSDDDKYIVLCARQNLIQTRREILFQWLFRHHEGGPVHGCDDQRLHFGYNCYEFLENMRLDFMENEDGFFYDRTDALTMLSPEATHMFTQHLCDTCRAYFTNAIAECYTEAFDTIPDCMGYDDWPTVHRMHKHAVSPWMEEAPDENSPPPTS